MAKLYVFKDTNDLLILFFWGQTYFLFERKVRFAVRT